jgi:hypothetical protein
MNCQDARAYFSDLLDSHIGLTERIPLEAHLRECETCQQELEGLRLHVRARPLPAAWRPNFKLDFFGKALDRLRPPAWRPNFKLDFFGKVRARPRPAAWPPSFKLDFFSKVPERLRPADMVDRLRQRVLPRNRVQRARPRPAPLSKALEALRPSDTHTPRRSVHARERVPWRSRPGVARAANALAAVRRIDIAGPLRRGGSSLHLALRRVPSALAIVGKSLEVLAKFALDGGRKALQAAKKALDIGQKVLGIGLGMALRALESARRMLLTTCGLAILAWDHRRIFLPPLHARHLRLTATVLLVSLGAVGLFRYRAELDLAVRHWVPSAPSSGDATPPARMASTEPATRPEIPPVSAPVTVVPAPPALHPPPAPRAPERPTPEMPARVTAPPPRTKSSAPPPEPVASRRAPAPLPPVRDTRVSRVEKSDATKPERSETPPPKAKNGSAKQDMIVAQAPRRDNPAGTVSAPRAPAPTAPAPATPAPTTPAPSGARQSLDVVGKLWVKSRSGAERDLAALLAKAGGTTVSRQRGEKVTVIEAMVPNPSYGKFAEGLTRIGAWQIEAGRSRLPDPVRVAVRLAE